MPPRPCAIDSSVIIPLAKVRRLDVLAKTPSFRWHVTPIVRSELRSADIRDALEGAILQGLVTPVDVDVSDARLATLFSEWADITDPGEAEAIAIAIANDWLVALEDRDAQRKLNSSASGIGRWINSANILLDAVGAGHMTLPEADSVFRSLSVYRGYALRGIPSLGVLR